MDVANITSLTAQRAPDKARESDGISEEREAELRKTAQEFESVFIAEMLSHAGFDKALSQESGYGGEAFSRMLVETYAEDLAEKGGFGLADQIYKQLKGQL